MKNELKIYKSYKLKKLTTFKIGGKAEFFCMPQNLHQLISALKFADENKIKRYILGGGSNILFTDNLIKGIIISTKKLNKCSCNSNLVTVECGLPIKELNSFLIKHKLSGMEFSGGLPGSIGGAVYMNARAYNGEMSDIVQQVKAIDENYNIISLNKDQLEYSYKSSIFMKKTNHIIYAITLNLKKDNKKGILQLYKTNQNDRKSKGQFKYPSAGCIFKNDYNTGIPTGKIIDSLGLKNKKIGGAEVFANHCNFIINKKNAKAEDVIKLIELIEKEVYQKKGLKLEREIRIIQ